MLTVVACHCVYHCSGSIPADKIMAATKTQHSWGFVKRLTDRDKSSLAAATTSIKTDTATAKTGGSAGGGGGGGGGGDGPKAARPSVAPRGEITVTCMRSIYILGSMHI